MVKIEFQNTLDDYREANGIAAPPRGWKAVRRCAAGCAVLAAGLLGMLGMFGLVGGDAFEVERFPWGRLVRVLTPSLVLCALFAWFLLRQVWKTPEPWNPPAQPSRVAVVRGVSGWLLFIVLAVLLFRLRSTPVAPGPAAEGPQPPDRLPAYFEHLLPLLGWVFLIAVLILFARLQRGRGVRRAWAAITHEHAPRVLHVTEAGLTLEQPSARQEFQWGHFAGYRETANLILLYPSPYAFFMIPKRAFADPLHLAAFKGIVMSGIPKGHFLPADSNAFPVVPMAPLAESANPPPVPPAAGR